jgi:hypothetical protein
VAPLRDVREYEAALKGSVTVVTVSPRVKDTLCPSAGRGGVGGVGT